MGRKKSATNKTVDQRGYALLWMPDHRLADVRGYVYEQRIIEVQKGLNGPTIQLCATCWDLRVSLKYYFNILGL